MHKIIGVCYYLQSFKGKSINLREKTLVKENGGIKNWYRYNKKPRIKRGLKEYGSYLLSQGQGPSTIGHEGLNFSVRNGKR